MPQAQRYFDTADLDKDGKLDKEEIRTKAQHILGLAFNTVDVDNDGVLKSLDEALTKVKSRVFDHILDEVFPAFAGDDDKLCPEDFVSDLSEANSWP